MKDLSSIIVHINVSSTFHIPLFSHELYIWIIAKRWQESDETKVKRFPRFAQPPIQIIKNHTRITLSKTDDYKSCEAFKPLHHFSHKKQPTRIKHEGTYFKEAKCITPICDNYLHPCTSVCRSFFSPPCSPSHWPLTPTRNQLTPRTQRHTITYVFLMLAEANPVDRWSSQTSWKNVDRIICCDFTGTDAVRVRLGR